MNPGFLNIVLHAHLPFVHHPEYPYFLEETWLFEAITECYLPLLAMLERLDADGIDYGLTLSLSPTLLNLWRSPLLRGRYLAHLQRQIALADAEVQRTCGQPAYQALARFYAGLFRDSLRRYCETYAQDLTAAFVACQRRGRLELITTAATHGYLPLLNPNPAAVRTQIAAGVAAFRAATGIQPKGFWLPECGYYPGLEELLAEQDLRYFFVDSHGLTAARPMPAATVYAPVDCGNGVAAFGRDPASSNQVWSATEGYPGDPAYREFHCDIGFELDEAALAGFLPTADADRRTGIKYQSIGTGGVKPPYRPEAARATASRDAGDFLRRKAGQIAELGAALPQPPLIVAPFDAELFGHWWFEGPAWLESVLRQAAAGHSVRTLTCSGYLARQPALECVQPAASSWGQDGYSAYWLNASNDWIYPLLHKAQTEQEKLLADLAGKLLSPLQRRALNQAARSLLLAQASDWPFLLRAGASAEYARKAVTDHLARFNYLHDAIRRNRIDDRYLAALETMDDIFPELDAGRS